MPLQFASLYDGQEVFVGSACLLILAQPSSLLSWSLYAMHSTTVLYGGPIKSLYGKEAGFSIERRTNSHVDYEMARSA